MMTDRRDGEAGQRPQAQDWKDPATVQNWIANRTGGNPQREEQLDILATLLATLQPEGHRILDLGCGDGLVAALLLRRLPGSFVVGVDSSTPMLEAARGRLGEYPDRHLLIYGELQDIEDLELPAPFDAAIGVQSVHHLDGPGKQALFSAVAELLRPGGLLLLSDRVMLDSAALFPFHLALWSRLQERNGGTPAEGYGYAAHLRSLELRGDRPDTVEDQLDWMRGAGFGEAACFYRYAERAIFGGLKQQPGPRAIPTAADQSREMADGEQPGV